MHYFLWVELDGFYASRFRVPEPLIVVREKVVLDANPLARQKGVTPGMEVRQATALVSKCVVKKWTREEFSAHQNAWLDVCTDYTGIIEPIDQHVAALDLSGHPNPLDVTEKLIRALASETAHTVRYGAANSKWIAKLATDRHDLGRAVESPESFVADLPVFDLLPVREEHRQRLAFLGYRTIGDVAQISLETLRNQFEDEGLMIWTAAQGRHFQSVKALYPLDSIRECFIFDGAAELWETVENSLHALADQLGRRLLDRGMQSSKLHLQIETEDGSFVERDRRFTKPILNPTSALIGLRLLLEGTLTSPTAAIRVVLSDLERTVHAQTELFGIEQGRKRPKALSAVHYLRTVFGDGSIKLGSEVEVPRRVRVLREWQNATGWR